MTTVDSDDDIEKLPHIQWDNTTVPGPSGCMFPGELTPLECQIAGHPFNGEKQTIGKCDLVLGFNYVFNYVLNSIYN